MGLTFFYKITDKGRERLKELNMNASHYNGNQWAIYAPQAAMLQTMEDSSTSLVSMKELVTGTERQAKDLIVPLNMLVQHGYVKYEGQVEE